MPAQPEEVEEALEEGIELVDGGMLVAAREDGDGVRIACTRVRFVPGGPRGRFSVTRVEGSDFELHGKLTIRGTTKDVVLAGENLGAAKDPWGNDRVVFSAKTTISRGEFGLTWNQALETGGVLVADKVEIELDVQAVKQK